MENILEERRIMTEKKWRLTKGKNQRQLLLKKSPCISLTFLTTFKTTAVLLNINMIRYKPFFK